MEDFYNVSDHFGIMRIKGLILIKLPFEKHEQDLKFTDICPK